MTKLTNGLYTGSHQNETAPDLEKIKQAEEAKAELRKAFLASSEEWRDTFYSHSEELGIKIAGIEQVRMDPYSLNTIWENEYESPEKNHFECSLEVSAKPDEYGPFVRWHASVEITNGKISNNEVLTVSPGMKFWGKENFTDIDVPVTKEGIFGIVCKFYEPVIGSATKLSRPRYRVEYTETVEIWSIARFQVNPEKEGLISDFGHSCQGDPEFEKLLTEAEKELADMFGKPDFKLPTQIDLAATISRSAEGYFSGNKTTTFVEKSLDSE